MKKINIDKSTYKANKENYYGISSEKKQIVIGYSLRKENNHILRYKNKSFDYAKQHPHFTIDRDGNIFEHFDPKYYSNYIVSPKSENKISIVLSNFCLLSKNDNQYISRLNEVCPEENVVEVNIKEGFRYWEKLSEKQYNSLVELCIYLCNKFDINQKIIEFEYFMSNIEKFNGICFRSNYVRIEAQVNASFNLNDFIIDFNNNIYESKITN